MKWHKLKLVCSGTHYISIGLLSAYPASLIKKIVFSRLFSIHLSLCLAFPFNRFHKFYSASRRSACSLSNWFEWIELLNIFFFSVWIEKMKKSKRREKIHLSPRETSIQNVIMVCDRIHLFSWTNFFSALWIYITYTPKLISHPIGSWISRTQQLSMDFFFYFIYANIYRRVFCISSITLWGKRIPIHEHNKR